MKPNLGKVLDQCIDIGIEVGWNQAHKYDEDPEPYKVQEAIRNAILLEIHEWFHMGNPND